VVFVAFDAKFDGHSAAGGGNIDGQLVCKNLEGDIEYHPYFVSGCLVLPRT
jgi:hypothetical protein